MHNYFTHLTYLLETEHLGSGIFGVRALEEHCHIFDWRVDLCDCSSSQLHKASEAIFGVAASFNKERHQDGGFCIGQWILDFYEL